jgi:hypothetical protein
MSQSVNLPPLPATNIEVTQGRSKPKEVKTEPFVDTVESGGLSEGFKKGYPTIFKPKAGSDGGGGGLSGAFKKLFQFKR